MQGYIYVIVNIINNKCYVGQTSRSVETRWAEHKRDISKFLDRPLYRALHKYGVENFTLTTLGCYDKQILDDVERKFIAAFDSFHNGYNATLGGEGGRCLEVPGEVLLQNFTELGSLKEVAKLYKVDPTTIGKLIKEYTGSGVGRAKSKPTTRKKVLFIEENKEFESLKACAQYLINLGVCEGSADSVSKSLTKACSGTRASYKKLHFKYI